MKVRVELQAYLDQYSPNGDDAFDYEVPDGARVKDLVVKLGMPEELASVIIVGETNADPSHGLKEGDRVILIPPLAGGARVHRLRVWPTLARVAMITGIVGGVLFLLLLVVSIAAVALPSSGSSGMSIDREPIALDEANRLIESGQVYRIAIRKEGNIDEYFLLNEGPDARRKWSVEDVDVHIFSDSIPTGVPILADDQGSVGLTDAEFDHVVGRVNGYNATASSPIDVLDQRN